MPTLIDPEQIYPKRLGMYKGALVIQYYNLQKDCFKKHLIPYDSSQSTDKILQSILKNPKHSAFLRKVSPNYIRQAISGKTIILPSEMNEKSSQNQFSSHHRQRDSGSYYTGSDSNKSYSQNRGNSYNTNSYTGSNSQYPSSEINDNWKKKPNKFKQMDNSESYSRSPGKDNNRIDSSHNLEQSHGYSMNFDEESMNISVVPVKQITKNSHIIEEQIDYKQDFQELSAQKLDIENEKLKQKQRQREKQREKQKQKQKEKQQKKDQKKEKKKKQKQLDQFQFLDDEQPKKKKKKKKDKSKDKQSKSKNKESNSSENPSKEASVREQIPIEEEFDFI